MTREQARREIDSLDYYLQNHTNDYSEESHTAMMMAKDALGSSEKPNTCGDAISRQAAIEAIEALQLPIMREASSCYQFKFSGMSEAKEAVVNLPSVTPQQRTGRWITLIDEYGDVVEAVCSCCDKNGNRKWEFCPTAERRWRWKDE